MQDKLYWRSKRLTASIICRFAATVGAILTADSVCREYIHMVINCFILSLHAMKYIFGQTRSNTVDKKYIVI